jgi:hypothetical protein
MWIEQFARFFIGEQPLEQFSVDQALFFAHATGVVVGIISNFVDLVVISQIFTVRECDFAQGCCPQYT